MFTAFILAMLLYRGYRYSKKTKLKVSHSTVFAIVMLLTILALIAVFDSHNYRDPPTPNLYSLHSWIGLTAVIVFGCQVRFDNHFCIRHLNLYLLSLLQWVAGFISFMYPQIRTPLKMMYMPLHIYFGLFGYMLVITAAVMGLSEKAFFKLYNYLNYICILFV